MNMNGWEYKMPVRVVFGEGKVATLANEIKNFGGHCGLLVTSPSFVKRGVATLIQEMSDGLIAGFFSQVSPNPDVKECDACAARLRELQCDFVVALGGGSVMDCAKAAATFCISGEPSTLYLGTDKSVPQEHLPIIAVPTTAGTASEVTSVSVLTDHERGIKTSFSSFGFYPTLAIIDPELTYSVPPYLTACTGFDVICHAIECYWNYRHQPVCDTLAIRALQLALPNLEKAYHEPGNKEARACMAEASVTAGLAFSNTKTSAPHACSYPLTNIYHIPHGEACMMTMCQFLRLNAIDTRVQALAVALGFTDVNAMADELSRMMQATGMRRDLKGFHLTDTDITTLVEKSKSPNLYSNPVEVTDEFLYQMYHDMR